MILSAGCCVVAAADFALATAGAARARVAGVGRSLPSTLTLAGLRRITPRRAPRGRVAIIWKMYRRQVCCSVVEI